MAVYVSDLLTATAAPVSAAPTSTRTWQWLRGSTTISGVTSTTYTTTADDIGSTISARQSETNFLGTATATSAPTEVIQAFDPIRLFSASEPGVWYDPNDISTLFKGPTVQAPVTTPGDSVWLMLDKSRGTALGPDLVVNGGFSSSANWITQAGWSIAGDKASASASNTAVYQGLVGTVNGAWYRVTFTVSDYVSGSVSVVLRGGQTPSVSSNGTFTALVGPTSGSDANCYVAAASNFTGSIDNISVKELPGNHATQPTTASQPIYGIVPAGGRRNSFTYSEDFSDAIYTKNNLLAFGSGSTVNATVAPDGTTTADLITPTTGTALTGVDQYYNNTASAAHTLSVYVKANGANFVQLLWNLGLSSNFANFDITAGTAGAVTAGTYTDATITPQGNDWFRCTITSTLAVANQRVYINIIPATNSARAAAYTGNGTSGIYIWGAQLELGTTATPYQRVTTQYDVTEAGVASLGYLFFDGSGDFMSTGTITPGTDKAQVFTGVQKLTSGGFQAVVELSANPDGSNGVVGLLYSGSTTVYAQSKGTNYVQAYSPEPVPNGTTSVLTAQSDISGPSVSLRSAGVQVVLNTASQGTGNYLAYPLYIGRRGGASLPFSGNLFPLIVRFGPNLTTARIQSTELWVGERTPGIDLTKLFSPLIYTRSGDTILDRANSTIERRAV